MDYLHCVHKIQTQANEESVSVCQAACISQYVVITFVTDRAVQPVASHWTLTELSWIVYMNR
jgi:hypothetical protein